MVSGGYSTEGDLMDDSKQSSFQSIKIRKRTLQASAEMYTETTKTTLMTSCYHGLVWFVAGPSFHYQTGCCKRGPRCTLHQSTRVISKHPGDGFKSSKSDAMYLQSHCMVKVRVQTQVFKHKVDFKNFKTSYLNTHSIRFGI